MFGRGVRPRVYNSDHRGQRVYEGSALAVLYLVNIEQSPAPITINIYFCYVPVFSY